MADPKIQFYYNFSTMLNSGVPIFRAITLAGNTLRGRFRRVARQMEQDVRGGMSIAESMGRYPRVFNPTEIEIVRAGEESGQLSEMLEELSRWCEFAQGLRRTFWGGMILPFLVLHGAAIGFPMIFFIRSIFLGQADFVGFIRNVIVLLVVYYMLIGMILGIFFYTPNHGPMRKILDAVVYRIPLLGRAVRDLSLSRYANMFSMLYGAGVPIVKAARQATVSCGNWRVYHQLKGATAAAETGENMSRGFPRTIDREFRELWVVGEESGELDKATRRLGQIYAERAERRFKMLASGIPYAIYLLVLFSMAGLVVYLFLMLYGSILRSVDI